MRRIAEAVVLDGDAFLRPAGKLSGGPAAARTVQRGAEGSGSRGLGDIPEGTLSLRRYAPPLEPCDRADCKS